uniref:Peptidase A1 domain-containing protein n=1 Tax=Ditylenchus dipsaci TaxID=166011 RepID=A0A915DQD6_9BILA
MSATTATSTSNILINNLANGFFFPFWNNFDGITLGVVPNFSLISSSGVHKVSVTRVESLRKKYIHQGLLDKYRNGKNGSSYENVYRHSTSNLSVILDTGSPQLWVVDSTVNNSTGKKVFHQKASTSYHNNGTKFINYYGTGSSSGFLGYDTVELGTPGDTIFHIKNTLFGQVTDMDEIMADSQMDGIFGLSMMVDEADPIFTVYLNSSDDDSKYGKHNEGGVFTFGGADADNCGPVIDWVNMTSENYYQFKLDGMTIEGKFNGSKSMNVVVDSGCSISPALIPIAKSLAEAVGAKLKEGSMDGTVYSIDCDASYLLWCWK